MSISPGSVTHVRRADHNAPPSSRSSFLGLPRELRNMVYGWILLACSDWARVPEYAEALRLDTPLLSDAFYGKSTRNLRRVSSQIRQEYIECAFAKCKVVGFCLLHVLSFDLVHPNNSIGTLDLSRVSKYELSSMTGCDDWISDRTGRLNFEEYADTAINCLPALKDLTLRMAYYSMTDAEQTDPQEEFIQNRFLEFQPQGQSRWVENQIQTIKKVATVGFSDKYYGGDFYPHVFEYKHRVDQFNSNTRRLEETSNFVRDGAFWKYIEDYNEQCFPYHECLKLNLPFKQAHDKIKRLYDDWVESGKPKVEEVPQVKICKAIEDLEGESPSEFLDLVDSFVHFARGMGRV